MPELTSESGVLSLFLVGAGAAVMGLVGLLWRRAGRAGWRVLLTVAAGLALAGGAAALAGEPAYLWQSAALLSLVLGAIGLGRTACFTQAGHGFVRLVGHPSLHAACLLVGGLGLVAWQAYALDSDQARGLAETDRFLEDFGRVPDLQPVTDLLARTDAGRPVPLWRPAPGEEDRGVAELPVLRERQMELKLIRTDAAGLRYNCHGWVFTGGLCWVKGDSVDQLLKDNQYAVTYQPAPGDLAVFRDEAGTVLHTALVRGVQDDDAVLLESKWGQMGRFIHTTAEHIYSRHAATYYRSPRPGHLLRGLEEARGAAATNGR